MGSSEMVEVRQATDADKPFIYASWLKGLRYGNEWFGLIESQVYFTGYHSVLERILEDPLTSIQIACLKEDPDVILGYSVFTGVRLHWIFVKKAFRLNGIAKRLVPEEISSVTHLTEAGRKLLKKYSHLTFNPFI